MEFNHHRFRSLLLFIAGTCQKVFGWWCTGSIDCFCVLYVYLVTRPLSCSPTRHLLLTAWSRSLSGWTASCQGGRLPLWPSMLRPTRYGTSLVILILQLLLKTMQNGVTVPNTPNVLSASKTFWYYYYYHHTGPLLLQNFLQIWVECSQKCECVKEFLPSWWDLWICTGFCKNPNLSADYFSVLRFV